MPNRSYRSLLFKFWTLCVFSHSWGLRDRTTYKRYDVHIGLIGKRCSGLPFSLCVTAEALRAKIDRKSAISLQFDPKFHTEGDVPHPTVVVALVVVVALESLDVAYVYLFIVLHLAHLADVIMTSPFS